MQKKLIYSILFVFFLVTNFILPQDDPTNADAVKLFNEGNSLLKAGNFNGAIEDYKKALQFEKHYKIYYQLGYAQKKSGKFDDAISSFNSCIQLKSDFINAYHALGSVYYSMGDYTNAISNFDKGLSLSKDESTKKKFKKNISSAYTKLGDKEISNGNAQKAINYLTKAVENENYDAAYLSLARLYSELGEWDKSISASENALKYKSKITIGGPYYYMGVSYKGKGDTSKATEMFEKAKSDPTYKKNAEYELGLLK